MIWLMVISAAALIFVPSVSVEITAVAAIPVSFVIANYMTFTRRVVMAEVLFWLMVIMLVVSRLWPV
jgi:hypothetical protein